MKTLHQILRSTMLALALVTAYFPAQVLALGSTPVTVVNQTTAIPTTITNTAPIPITGTVGVTGSVNVTNTVPVTGNVGVTGNVNITNTDPIKVKSGEPARSKITLSIKGADAEVNVISARVTLPGPAILESIGSSCNIKVDYIGVLSQDDTANVEISSDNTVSFTANWLYFKPVPFTEAFGDYLLPLTKVELPIANRMFSVAAGHIDSSSSSLACTVSVVVRYIQ